MFDKKKLIVTVCLSATVVFAAAAAMQTEPEKHEWKNLKVLPKTITDKELDHVMDEWRDALGVRCGFCHARDNTTNKTDYASDAKPEKEMARKMYLMQAKINKKFFKMDKDDKSMTAAITCYVCHHGAAHPVSEAPPRPPRVPGQGGPGAPPAGQTPPPASTTPPPTTTPPGR